VLQERLDIVLVFPQGLERQGDDRESEVEVLPEPRRPDGLFQVAVRRDYDANVHGDVLHAADTPERLSLQDAQELGLHPESHFTHFVEEQRAAVGHFKHAAFERPRIREGALFVAEQLRFYQGLGIAAQLMAKNGRSRRDDS